jgi:hypothetical protein
VEHLRLAIAFMMMLSVVTFVVTSRVLSRASSLTLNVAAVITMLLIAAYVYLVWGQLWIVNWIPLPAVVVLSNWFPILLAVLATNGFRPLTGFPGESVFRRPTIRVRRLLLQRCWMHSESRPVKTKCRNCV